MKHLSFIITTSLFASVTAACVSDDVDWDAKAVASPSSNENVRPLTPDASPSPQPLDTRPYDFLMALGKARCERAERCLAPLGYSISQAACLENWESNVNEVEPYYRNAVKRKLFRFSASNAASCVEAERLASCGEEIPAVCTEVFAPAVAQGEPCNNDRQCMSVKGEQGRCAFHPDTTTGDFAYPWPATGTCESITDIGDQCDFGYFDEALWAQVRPSTPCSVGSHCAHYAETLTCAPALGAGEACSPEQPKTCGEGLYCGADQRCQPFKSFGESCSRFYECAGSCSGGVCVTGSLNGVAANAGGPQPTPCGSALCP